MIILFICTILATSHDCNLVGPRKRALWQKLESRRVNGNPELIHEVFQNIRFTWSRLLHGVLLVKDKPD